VGGQGARDVSEAGEWPRYDFKFWQNCIEMVSVKLPLAIRLVNGYWQK